MSINRTLLQESIPGESEENLQNREEQDYQESNGKIYYRCIPSGNILKKCLNGESISKINPRCKHMKHW